MLFEWDEAKNRANRKKHGIRFEEAALIFQGPVLTRFDDVDYEGEAREISLGAIMGLAIVVVVHTERNGRTRIISARKAARGERDIYEAHLKKALEGD